MTTLRQRILTLIMALLLSQQCLALIPETRIPSPDQALKHSGVAQNHSLDAKSIKLLNWNIYKGAKSQWASDFAKIKENYDLLTLQEIQTKSEVENQLTLMDRYESIYAFSFEYLEDNSLTGLATLSKANNIEKTYRVTHDFEPIIKTPKVSLYTKYRIANELGETEAHLLVVNIHGINFVRKLAFTNQLSQVREEIQKHHGPVILAGDFNTWSSGRMIALYNLTKSLKLSPVRFTPDTRKKVMGLALDHIFYRGLNLKEANSLHQIKSSDHVAMEAEFSL